MSKINKNSIYISFKLLAILAFGLVITPVQVSASGGRNITYGDFSNDSIRQPIVREYTAPTNPKPVIYAISPEASDRNMNGASITITGKGFVPGSIARINGSNRATSFIDPNHLIVQATGADMYRTDGGFYVTVSNSAPGGGFSNSEFFTVRNAAPSAQTNGTNGNYYDPNAPVPAEDFSSLTSNAIYGSNTFLPSGAVQWVLFAIIILLLVILARKFFGGEETYHAAPLKHD